MADALNPWLLSYMTSIAETYGAQLHTVPFFDKKKKVQIIDFLTYGSNEEPTYVWGRVSEKEYTMSVKFSKEAVAKFESLDGGRLTQCKGGIVTITKFRPMFSRLPGSQGGKSSLDSYLALECESVSLLGSVGESTFGSPKPITTHPDMHLWSQGLNEPGGAGNVLKQRKQEGESHNNATKPVMRQCLMPPPAAPGAQNAVVKKKVSPPRNIEVVDLETYRARWQIVEKNPAYRHPPWQNEDVFDSKQEGNDKIGSSSGIVAEANLPNQTDNIHGRKTEKDLSATSQDAPKQSDIKLQSADSEIETSEAWKSRSATPLSSWLESSPGSKASADDHFQATNSSLAPPTPAQRAKRSINTIDFPPSSFRNESIADIEPDISSSQVVSAIQQQPVAVVPRRVPRPTSPQPRRTTGPERVLVPNSDTSGTQSQSLTQSQSQSQHQMLVQTEVPSSRRTNVLKDADMDIDEANVKKVRKRSSFRAKSASYSPRGVRSTSATNWVGDNDQALAESSRSSKDSDDEENNDGGYKDEDDEKSERSEEEDYPWMSLLSAREMLAKAEAHRKGGLANT